MHVCKYVRQDGRTALIVASKNGHTDSVRVLLAAGADKDAKERATGEMVDAEGTVPTAYLPYLHFVSQEYHFL